MKDAQQAGAADHQRTDHATGTQAADGQRATQATGTHAAEQPAAQATGTHAAEQLATHAAGTHATDRCAAPATDTQTADQRPAQATGTHGADQRPAQATGTHAADQRAAHATGATNAAEQRAAHATAAHAANEHHAAPAVGAPHAVQVRDIYLRQVAERGFREDPVQLAVIAKLDDLRRRLIESASSGGERSSLLGRLLRGLGRGSSRRPQKGLYLWGGVGRGKTWMMDLFVQSLPFPQVRRRHFHRFMHDVHAELKTLRNQEQPLEHVADTIAQDTRVLCFDELFVTDIADAMILGGLFDGLFRRGVTLVATSNVPPRDLYKDGLQRQRFVPAIELIEQQVEVVAVMGATDYRLRQLTQAGTYLSSRAQETTRRLEALFEELAGRCAHTDGVIEIEGRPISVLRECDGAVWFDFPAICSGPRSQDDYIEIAREYQSVVVSNVPIFDARREDEARRFIALVDELYDRNVNLILSAAAAPTELYRGERLTFPFQRTASRLIEMQSEEYLAREHRP